MGKVKVQMGIIELALAIALGIILARIVLKIFNVFIHLSSGAIAFLIVMALFILLCLYLILGEGLENQDAGSIVVGIALIAAFACYPLFAIWSILEGVIEGYRKG